MEERLDRFCSTSDWMALFPSFRVDHLDEKLSDQLPLLLHTVGHERGDRQWRRRKRRRFEIMWADDDRCEAIVRSAWDRVEGGDVVTSYVSR